MKRPLVILLVGLTLFLNSCAPATTPAPATEGAQPSPQPEATSTFVPTHLKVGALNFMSHSPLHIAVEDGYFAAQGLDVELIDFGTSDRDMLPVLLSGQLDAGAIILASYGMHAIEEGGNLKYVADKGFIDPSNACVTDAWLARNDLLEGGTLETTEGLRGRKMTNSVGNTLEYANDLMLRAHDLALDDMEIVDVRDQVARLEAIGNGTLDLYGVSEPWITRAINTGNAGIWRSFVDYVPGITVGGIVFGPTILEGDPEVGVRFMVAYLQAVAQFNEGKTERNVEVISGFTQLDPTEVQQLCWTRFQPDGRIDQKTLSEFMQWGVEKGYIDAPMTVDQVWDPQYVDAAYARLHK